MPFPDPYETPPTVVGPIGVGCLVIMAGASAVATLLGAARWLASFVWSWF